MDFSRLLMGKLEKMGFLKVWVSGIFKPNILKFNIYLYYLELLKQLRIIIINGIRPKLKHIRGQYLRRC